MAVNLILTGVVRRWPNIRFNPLHGGGTLPFPARRTAAFDGIASFSDNYPEGTMACIRRFRFDTALSGDTLSLPALHAAAARHARPWTCAGKRTATAGRTGPCPRLVPPANRVRWGECGTPPGRAFLLQSAGPRQPA